MKTKFLIPALAFVSAIGMSFTTANQQESDYIRVDDQWEAIPEINCSPQSNDCRVVRGGEGPFDVYDTMDLNSKKEGDGSITVLP
ncbi:DUF6520 family protein [Zunongwangia endophytica]|uniref:DUF6520 family protein n=1 Tax=Zunongwangia endophytica TaxID=1808945 RepID=A0ABV8HC72_9FLAO|nr:DUF6520 family protein [Zunongwangia endophytica]MDN3594390.1 DUF6520 family protein [Zunongwangia endophytica]